MSERQDDFQQRVIASTLPHDPELTVAATLFPELGQETTEDGDIIFFPSSEEEFAEMARLYEEQLGGGAS